METVRVAHAASSRHDPARLAPATLLRGRLVGLLSGRFERRLTVIDAGAGFGKSTLLAQATHENRIERIGIDALLRVTERDQDPERLIEGLAESLGTDGAQATVDRLMDAVWTLAPNSVALIVDDSHRLGESDASWEVLAALLDRLPSNGHLVVSGRRSPRLPVARLMSQGDALVISESELAFTDDELAAVAALRSIPSELVPSLPRWPALVTLTGAVGHRASIDYLWQEVLGSLPADRRRLLAAVAPFGEVDDQLVDALGGSMSAADLVAGVPLVDSTDDGCFWLHDLWVDALSRAIDPEARKQALRAGGSMLLARNELGRAGEAYALAGDELGLSEVLLAFARRPTLVADVNEIDRLYSLLPESMHARPGTRYLDAARHYATDDRQAAAAFAIAASEAQACGETELEVLSRWRAVQFADLDQPNGPAQHDRVVQLAEEGVPLALAVRAFVDSRLAQVAGDPDESLRQLAGLDHFGPEQREMSRAVRLVDLGRPEALNATIDDVLAGGLSDLYGAQAAWLQGQIDPVDAWPFGRELPSRTETMPLMSRIAITSVVVAMGVAAGAHDEVVALAQSNRRRTRSTAGLVELFAEVAHGLVQLVVEDERAAVATFTELLDEVPLGAWPERPYLYALAVIRGLLPGGERLDACEFGPSLTVAVESGAALAALRTGDATGAAALPWRQGTLLRVHVPPPLLAELALAAGPAPGAAEALKSIPHLRTWLRRIAERDPGPGAVAVEMGRRATAMARTLPARPPRDLRIGLLGGLSLERSDGAELGSWDRRERVRHLLAYVAMGRDVSRAEAAADLWPDLPAERAAANLRVNLHHLQRALQPERDVDDPPWFLQSNGKRMWLAVDGVTIDSELIDDAMAHAVRAEAAGLPSEALGHYERVAELANGDLLSEIHAEWVVYERIRLRSLVQAAASRQGELVLARGEPEAALGIATRAQRLDPLSERAHRLSIRCHLALGSASAAHDSAALLRSTLAEAGLQPDHDTRVLLAKVES